MEKEGMKNYFLFSASARMSLMSFFFLPLRLSIQSVRLFSFLEENKQLEE